MASREITSLRPLWEPSGVYLNTASYGLPPRPAWEAFQRAQLEWRSGEGVWEEWIESVNRARALFARLVSVPSEWVAAGSAVSGFASLVASCLPDGARVVAPDMEFTSTLFPFLAQADRGVRVQVVPSARIAEAVVPGTSLVALSGVQSSSGEVAALQPVVEAARAVGAAVFVDATQACGWLPVDASRVDFLACAAYKWLMAPRGVAFFSIRPEWLDRIRPSTAGWFAGEDVHSSYYGPPLRLAHDARRFDLSPAWFSWIGTVPALQLLLDAGIDAIQQHDVELANRFLRGRGQPEGDSAIVQIEAEGAEQRLHRAGVRCAVRAGKVRASFHLYNTEADVDRALEALA